MAWGHYIENLRFGWSGSKPSNTKEEYIKRVRYKNPPAHPFQLIQRTSKATEIMSGVSALRQAIFAKVLIPQTFAVGGVVAHCHEKLLVRASQSGSEGTRDRLCWCWETFSKWWDARPLDTHTPSKNCDCSSPYQIPPKPLAIK